MKAKITKRTVDAARPGKSDLFIWDEDVTGFGLKVTPKGKKFYLLEYRMGVRQRRYTIGRHGAPLTPDVARELAIKVRHFIAKNCNPAIVKARFGQDHMRRRLIKRLARTHVGSAVGRALTAPFFRAFSLTVGRCGRYRDGVIEILPAVREGAVSKVAPPRVQGAPLKVSETPIPPNVPFRFRNAAVLGEVSVVGTDKGAFLPDSDFRSPDRLFTTPKSYYVHTKFGDGIVSRFLWGRVIDKGIAVIGSCASNWFHWLIETVPRAHLAARLSDEFADWPLLVPETCLPGTSFYEALEPFFGARRVVPISNCEWTLVRDLVLIDAPCFGPIHTWTGAWPRTSDYVSDVELLSEMRSIYIDCFQIRRGDGPRRIFLSRSKSERLYNQKAIEEIAAAFGFVIVHPETLSFRDQIQLFHNADCIVGPSGAAWSGILFSRPGTVGLNWTFPEYSEACMFTNLALVSGVELFHFFVDSFQDLKCSDDAFRASYAVSERFFEDQLGQLIERVPSGEVQGPGGERKL